MPSKSKHDGNRTVTEWRVNEGRMEKSVTCDTLPSDDFPVRVAEKYEVKNVEPTAWVWVSNQLPGQNMRSLTLIITPSLLYFSWFRGKISSWENRCATGNSRCHLSRTNQPSPIGPAELCDIRIALLWFWLLFEKYQWQWNKEIFASSQRLAEAFSVCVFSEKCHSDRNELRKTAAFLSASWNTQSNGIQAALDCPWVGCDCTML